MTTLYTILAISIVLNIMLLIGIRSALLDNMYYIKLIEDLEQELNEVEK